MNDDGNGATGDNVDDVAGNLGLGARPLLPSSLPRPGGDDGGIAMTITGGGLGLGFGSDSSRRQPPAAAAAAAERQRRVRWEREGGQRRQPTNEGAQRCHAATSKRRGATRDRGAG